MPERRKTKYDCLLPEGRYEGASQGAKPKGQKCHLVEETKIKVQGGRGG